MKLLTKEEEDAHYRAVLQGGTVGCVLGIVGGVAGVMAASRRYHTIRSLTLPMKTFLVTSSGTFVGIVAADHSSRQFEAQRNTQLQWYQSREAQLHQEEMAGMGTMERLTKWAHREKYKIVSATWVASMIGSFVLVGRNPYLSGQQKIVQARVYAQGLTLAVLVASAAFEIHDQRKGRGILEAAKKKVQEVDNHADNNEQNDLWKDMVAAEEQRLKSKHKSLYEPNNHHNHNSHADKQQPQPPQQEAETQSEPAKSEPVAKEE
ncbi:hypothetical protein ASPZODRAFT_156882 [Penicilliopsis zonata CBS 506.65]|uniref:HIG1 domain-containing protein n=1 Tax=Penicilliopsis zonata CBS 506.65 TaxID=1073090 RepID=A0A1L9SRV5_9EURO|nr:hypothetical protein ASPZODRAFT_156882 [Penicilliopsis zonata CBS 506.65]OJJ49847.1 hypothetical protein ASPZODRAFT_156882 [Penicilliopsis zonata CBS 506.65]